MNTEIMNGGVTDFFNGMMNDMGDVVKGLMKDAAGNIIQANTDTSSAQQYALQAQASARAASERNKNFMIWGGAAAGGLVLLLALTKK